MYPVSQNFSDNNHPLVSSTGHDLRVNALAEIDLLWSLYNAWPNHYPRLERAKAATKRIWTRKRRHVLPPRKAFETTVDYYESALPLYMAQKRFINFFHVDNYFRSVQNALVSVLPPKLFN